MIIIRLSTIIIIARSSNSSSTTTNNNHNNTIIIIISYDCYYYHGLEHRGLRQAVEDDELQDEPGDAEQDDELDQASNHL